MINPFDIIKETENMYHFLPGTITGHKRTRTVAEARAVAMYLVRKLTPYSWVEVGDHFNKDHTSVIHNCKKIEKNLKEGIQDNAMCVIIALNEKFTEVA